MLEHLSNPPSREDVSDSIKKLNLGQAAGSDGLFAEIFVHGDEHIKELMHSFLSKLWEGESVPENWANAIMVAIYKHKGFREYCGSYRGITLFVTLGKILAGILQKRLNEIAEHVLPETQCGFHASRAPVGRRGAVVKGVEHFSTFFDF